MSLMEVRRGGLLLPKELGSLLEFLAGDDGELARQQERLLLQLLRELNWSRAWMMVMVMMGTRLVEMVRLVAMAVRGLTLVVTDSQLATAHRDICGTRNWSDPRTNQRCTGRVSMIRAGVLLLQKVHPFVSLLLAVGLLLSRWVRVEVQQWHHCWDSDGRSVVVAEGEMVMVSRPIRVVAVVECTAG